MSITSRINEMSTHIEQAYDELQGLGADLTNVNKNIENISMVLDDIYDSLPSVSGEGTSLTLDDTRVGKIKSTLKGNTSQETTTGKNKLPNELVSGSSSGITYTKNSDGSIKLSGTATARVEPRLYTSSYVLPAGTYINTTDTTLYYYSNGYYSVVPNGTISLSQDITISYFYIRVENGETINKTIYPQLILSSVSDTSYEPYTGGNPAPNPDFPETINVVSGDNEINVCGKNLYSRDNGEYNVPVYATDGTSGSYQDVNVVWIKVNPSTDYSFTLLPNSKTYFVRIIECTGDKGFIYRFPNNYQPGSGVANTLTITTKNNCEWLQIAINQNQTSQISQNDWEVMIEKSSTPTTYEPYQGNTYNIDLPVENDFALPSEGTTTGITYSVNDNNTINLSGTATANTTFMLYKDLADSNIINGDTYTFSANKSLPSGVEIRFEAFNGTSWLRHILNSVLNSTTQKITNSANLTNATRIRYLIYVANGTSVDISNLGIQLEKGSKQNNFTPYGTTPIELCKIGTYQDKFIRNSGKNLANYLDIPNAPQWSDWPGTSKYIELTLKPNTQYTMSSNVPQGSQTLLYFNGDATATNGVWLNNSKTMTSDNNGKIYYALFTDRQYYSDIISGKYYIMLNEGSTPLPYEPYGNGDWYLHKEIGKVVLNGSESESWSVRLGTKYTHQITENMPPNSSTGARFYGFSNYYIAGNNWDISADKTFLVYKNASWSYANIQISDSSFANTTELKTWLSTHNTEVYYVLATPTNTEITYQPLIDQLNELEKAMSKDEQTNISQVNNDLPFIISASALKEWSV